MDAPRAAAQVTVLRLGDETLLYDRRRELVHVLNRLGGRVWDGCDGRRDARRLAGELRVADVPPAQVEADVRRLLDELEQLGLLEATGAAPVAPAATEGHR